MISFISILFWIVAVVTAGCALMVVTSSNLVHSALWLVAALFGVAVIFTLLQAGFLAVVQVVIYIGAIAILMIFAIMLTRRIAKDSGPRFNENWGWSAAIALIAFLAISFMVASFTAFRSAPLELDPRADTLRLLGSALVSPSGYVLPFELASVLLLAALIGSIYIAWERK